MFEFEKGKCFGILNGIDNEVWDPETDPMLPVSYGLKDADKGKATNKKIICETFGLDPALPLFIFIGRLVGEKAAEILPAVISDCINRFNKEISFLVLGSGETEVESQLDALKGLFEGNFNCYIGYNEKLAHQLYAGADFLLMPSRVEPCGLNQMYKGYCD